MWLSPIMTLDWGNVPEWLSFCMAGAAAIGAFLLLRKQGDQINLQAKQLRHEVSRAAASDQAIARERRIEQARNVHFRVTTQGGSSNGQRLMLPVAVEVTNNSAGVVNHVSVRVWCVTEPMPLDAGEQQHDLGRMLPAETKPARAVFGFLVAGLAPAEHPKAAFLSEVTFTDAAGVGWRIDHEHRLSDFA